MLTTEQKENWKSNRLLNTAEVIEKLPEDSRPFAYIVGKWVWITFQAKPEAEILETIKTLGFKWNPRRKAWQHPCGIFRKRANYDPRDKYGTVKLSRQEENIAQYMEKETFDCSHPDE